MEPDNTMSRRLVIAQRRDDIAHGADVARIIGLGLKELSR
jgi:hypothetical protein